MKKMLTLWLIALMILTLAGCGAASTEGGADVDTKAAIEAIMDSARAALGDTVFVPTTFTDAITAETSENMLGLTAAELEEYAMEAYVMIAGILTHPFQIALVKCKDYKSATEVKKLIADGFNSAKWVCVFPDQSFVVESGRFVLLGAVPNEAAEAFQKSFSDQFNTKAGTVNTFYDGADAEGGGGGLLLP